MKETMNNRLQAIGQLLYDKKGMNIVAIDVEGISTVYDAFVIAEGNVDRHVGALGHYLIDEMEKHGDKALYVDGLSDGDWAVIDFGDIVVHLFVPETRRRYRLEELWSAGRPVELNIQLPVR